MMFIKDGIEYITRDDAERMYAKEPMKRMNFEQFITNGDIQIIEQGEVAA